MRIVLREAVGDRHDILGRLRDRTAGAHERLHRLVPFAQLQADTINPGTYAALMARMLDFYRHFDRVACEGVERFRPVVASYAYEPRAVRLAADLDSLGTAVEIAGGAPRGWCLPSAGSAAALGGMLYVVDGAVLGGSILSRNAERFHPPGWTDGHWQWCRTFGGSQWHATRRLLVGLAVDHGAVDEMVRTASETFAAFEECMTAPVVHPPSQVEWT